MIRHRHVTKLALILSTCFGLAQPATTQDWPGSEILFAAKETRVSGHQDGTPVKDMYQCYREPVVIKTRSGRIVVGCHAGNKLEWPERSGQDFVIRYSDDDAKSWSKPILAAEHGNESFQSHGMVYDAEIDRIIVKYMVYRWDYSKVKGRGLEASAPAIQELFDANEEFSRQYMIYSDNGGETWSDPEQVPVDHMGQMPHYGSSEGRQLSSKAYGGRLIIPGGLRREEMGNVVEKTIGVWTSDDHGKNWNFVKILKEDPRNFSCEARITELQDGTLLYNVRTRHNGRQLARSKDGGNTWSMLEQHPDLKVTQCNGSMITLTDEQGKLTSNLLFSVPSPGGRKDGWIYASQDDGNTWPFVHQPMEGYFAYSALIQSDPDHILLFFESNHYEDIEVMKIPVNKLFSE